MRLINLISSMLMGVGVFVLILSIGFLIALFSVLLVSAGFEIEFDTVFLWLGIPCSVLFVVVWFYKCGDFSRALIFKR